MGNQFIMPKRVYYGENALASAKDTLAAFGKKALVVTDPMMVKLGNVKLVTDILDQNGQQYSVYSDVTGEPTDKMVDAGLQIYKNEECDFLIGIGGGSPIDTMKAVAVVAAGDGSIDDYMGKRIRVRTPRMVAIPTTSGTGSEATQFTIITNTEKDIKMLLAGSGVMPDLAIDDPTFTMTAPKSVTAATGLDALCHASDLIHRESASFSPMNLHFRLSKKYLNICRFATTNRAMLRQESKCQSLHSRQVLHSTMPR